MTATVDLAVVGSGPAASASARVAARHGMDCVIIAPPPAPRLGLLELLASTARPALAALSAGEDGLSGSHPLELTRFRWGRDDIGERQVPPSDGATIVDRATFDGALRRVAEQGGARRIDARVVDWTRDGSTWVLDTLPSAGGAGRQVRAARVLIAAGRGSRLMQRGGAVREVRHRMVAVIQRLPVPDLAGRMVVEPTPSGWWYGMGTAQRATIGFVTDADLLAPGTDRASATWRRERAGVDWVPPSGELELRAAVVACVDPAGASGVLPIGDAALSVDPLSGHGLRFALESGIRATLEPQTYATWLAEEQRRHAEDEFALYKREVRYPDAVFWQRRTTRLDA
jgi:flavin-dependent dehydrogenase